jgi:hypothetical protein
VFSVLAPGKEKAKKFAQYTGFAYFIDTVITPPF